MCDKKRTDDVLSTACTRGLDRIALAWQSENASHNRNMVTECLFACAEESQSQMFVMRDEQGL